MKYKIPMPKPIHSFPSAVEYDMTKHIDVTKLSIHDLGIQFATLRDGKLGIAAEMLRRYPDGKLSEETKAALEQAFRARKKGLTPDRWYEKVGADTYIHVKDVPSAERQDTYLCLSVDYATGFARHEFGKLRAEQPNLHGLIKGVRDAVSTYVSQTMADLVSQMNKLLKADAAVPRAANKSFKTYVDEVTGLFKKKAARARKDGFTDVPEDTDIEAAVAALYAKLFKKKA